MNALYTSRRKNKGIATSNKNDFDTKQVFFDSKFYLQMKTAPCEEFVTLYMHVCSCQKSKKDTSVLSSKLLVWKYV